MALITPGMVHATGGRKKMCKRRNDYHYLSLLHSEILIGDQFHVTTSFLVQTLTWLPECLNEKKDESHLVVGKYPYIFF